MPENNTEDVKKFLFNCIDLTTLNSTDSDKSVMHFTEKVNQFDDEYPDLKNVAAICVYPNFAAIVKNTLEVDGVNIACVSGGFPSSQTFIEVKVAETALAIAEGADEIDIVISIGKFLSGDYEGMCEEIQELKEVCKERHLKVILETGALKSASNIKDIQPAYRGRPTKCGMSVRLPARPVPKASSTGKVPGSRSVPPMLIILPSGKNTAAVGPAVMQAVLIQRMPDSITAEAPGTIRPCSTSPDILWPP